MKHADVAIYDPHGKLQLVAEVKNRSGASIEWVTQMRRNLVIHSVIPSAPYFLLALPDFFYLWRDARSMSDLVPPDYKIDAKQLLAPYINASTQSLNDVSEYGLELLVTSWLEDLMRSELKKDAAAPGLQWLFDSGLYDAIKNGSVAIETTV